MIKVEIKSNVSFPELKFQKDLKDIADGVIIPYLKNYIIQGTDVGGKPYGPLAKSTLKRKKGRVLYETGALFKSFYSQNRGDKEVVISLTSDRKNIGGYLQNEGIKAKAYGGKRYFEFFGVNNKMIEKAMNFIEEKIRKEFKNAKR
jgi:hypothetical protein